MRKTVAELIDFLRGLPSDAVVVTDAGGDCGGFFDVVSDGSRDYWQTQEIQLAPADGASTYHGAYDDWADILRKARASAPTAVSDEDAVRTFTETETQKLALIEEAASRVGELPSGYDQDIWTLDQYRDKEFRLSKRRAFVEFLRRGQPIRAVVLR